jgi:hypothetical protein
VDDFNLMELMGHADFTMMKRHAHLAQANMRKALAMLPGWTVVNTWHKWGTNEVEEEKGTAG